MEPFVDIDDYFDIVQRCQVNGLRAILRRLDSKRADYLLRARNPSEDNQTALLLAVIMKDEPTVRLLLQEGVDLYDGIEGGVGSTCLLTASKIDCPESVINLLLDMDSSIINTPNEIGWTPLIQACVSGDEPSVSTLLRQSGNDINHTDCWGRDASYYAAGMNRMKILRILQNRLGTNA